MDSDGEAEELVEAVRTLHKVGRMLCPCQMYPVSVLLSISCFLDVIFMTRITA